MALSKLALNIHTELAYNENRALFPWEIARRLYAMHRIRITPAGVRRAIAPGLGTTFQKTTTGKIKNVGS